MLDKATLLTFNNIIEVDLTKPHLTQTEKKVFQYTEAHNVKIGAKTSRTQPETWWGRFISKC
jgi:hypothetical protein